MLLKFKPLEWAFSGSYFTSICISGRGANIWDKTTDFHTLGNAYHCQAQLSLKVSRPDIWREVKQIVYFHSWKLYAHWWKKLETTETVFGLDNSLEWERDQHEFCPSDVWKSSSWVYLKQPTCLTLTGVQIHKPNIFALASLESYQSTPHQEYEVWKNKETIEHPKFSC